jgi:hypothetical protein
LGNHQELNVIARAFGHTGKYIVRRLLERGVAVRTLTGHPTRPNPFGDAVEGVPFNFERPTALKESLRGAATIFNTYWIRFERGSSTFARAVQNIQMLIAAGLACIALYRSVLPTPQRPHRCHISAARA